MQTTFHLAYTVAVLVSLFFGHPRITRPMSSALTVAASCTRTSSRRRR